MHLRLIDGHEGWFHRKHVANIFLGQDFRRSSLRYQTPFIKQRNLIREARCEIQVMNYSDGDNVGRVSEGTDLFHKVDLVMNIEERERLVEKQKAARRSCRTIRRRCLMCGP